MHSAVCKQASRLDTFFAKRASGGDIGSEHWQSCFYVRPYLACTGVAGASTSKDIVGCHPAIRGVQQFSVCIVEVRRVYTVNLAAVVHSIRANETG